MWRQVRGIKYVEQIRFITGLIFNAAEQGTSKCGMKSIGMNKYERTVK
jgi:hypothetical protein